MKGLVSGCLQICDLNCLTISIGLYHVIQKNTLFPQYFSQIGAGELPDDTTLICSRGSERFAII